MNIIVILLFITVIKAAKLEHNKEEYFRAIINVPKDCTLKTEPGIVSFIESGYGNYPLLVKLGSNKTTMEFFDVTDTLIEEVNIEGFKKTQIENLLDNRGFYCENKELFKEQEITEGDFSFLEYFTAHEDEEFVVKNENPVELQEMKEIVEEREKNKNNQNNNNDIKIEKKEDIKQDIKEEKKEEVKDIKKEDIKQEKKEDIKKEEKKENNNKIPKKENKKVPKKEEKKGNNNKELDELEARIKNMISKNGGVDDTIKHELNNMIFNNPNIKIVRYTEEDLKKDMEDDTDSESEDNN